MKANATNECDFIVRMLFKDICNFYHCFMSLYGCGLSTCIKLLSDIWRVEPWAAIAVSILCQSMVLIHYGSTVNIYKRRWMSSKWSVIDVRRCEAYSWHTLCPTILMTRHGNRTHRTEYLFIKNPVAIELVCYRTNGIRLLLGHKTYPIIIFADDKIGIVIIIMLQWCLLT